VELLCDSTAGELDLGSTRLVMRRLVMRLKGWGAFPVILLAAVLQQTRAEAQETRKMVVSVVATTDVHGRIESLPWLSGHLANLRAARAADGGGVLLVDSGDMFQGTLESNLGEGAAVVRGYNALGYNAVAVGNHEFDFGPAGPAHLAAPGDDARGALKARAAEARYPFLAANLRERGQPLRWKNVRPWVVVEVAGTRIGLIGVVTSGTPRATHPRNFAGMSVTPLARTIRESAQAARRAGARAVIVMSHAGGDCKRFDSPDDLGSCDPTEEIFTVARQLPRGLVDAIAAGHTHQGVAHRVAGVTIVQAHSLGRAFSRFDLIIDPARGRVLDVRLHPPYSLCGGGTVPSFNPDACRPPPYEGRPVAFDARLAELLAPDIARAAELRKRPVGIQLPTPVRRATKEESPLGNLAADLLRTSRPDAQVGFINGGSLRNDLPAGPLRYGDLYQAFPFDDGVAVLHLSARQLAALVARNLGRDAGILSLSGVRAVARCQGRALEVTLLDPADKPLPGHTRLRAVTNGYLASGGDGLIDGILTPQPSEEQPVRDVFAAALAARGRLDPDDPALFDPRRPRLQYEGRRPVRCPGPGESSEGNR
jgi:2',3'-cyclic-nucleotide 2'-phosphodiesterase (5'-nucleotidase family)